MSYNYSNIIYLLCKLKTKMKLKNKSWVFYLSLLTLFNIIFYPHFNGFKWVIFSVCSIIVSLILTECVEIILNLNSKNNRKL